MLKKVKKLVSLVLVLALSFVICVPTFAAEKGNCSTNITQLPVESLSSSGFTYGPWFGDGNESWDGNLKSWATLTEDISGALAVVIPNKVAKIVAGSIASACKIYRDYGTNPAYTYGTIHKTYREVNYSDGSFAYWQTKYVIHSYYVDDAGNTSDLGTTEKIYSGTSPMAIET